LRRDLLVYCDSGRCHHSAGFNADAVGMPTSLQNPNSLITGKITGNFAKSGPARRFSHPIDKLIQWLALEFPTQSNGEFF
jgi:hypothetical protein